MLLKWVISIDGFIEKFDEAINNNQKSAVEYFDEIRVDYERRQVIKIEKKKYWNENGCRAFRRQLVSDIRENNVVK